MKMGRRPSGHEELGPRQSHSVVYHPQGPPSLLTPMTSLRGSPRPPLGLMILQKDSVKAVEFTVRGCSSKGDRLKSPKGGFHTGPSTVPCGQAPLSPNLHTSPQAWLGSPANFPPHTLSCLPPAPGDKSKHQPDYSQLLVTSQGC